MMRIFKVLKVASVSLAILFVSACANLTHFNKKIAVDENSAVFVDAKQRGVYFYQKNKETVKDNTKVTEIMRGFCAEPNPDAVSAMAATLGLDLTVTDKGKLGLSNAVSEGVANIGLRTVAIQALRDAMYRNCEAYAGGGITEFGIETLQRRFQSTMVAILAIEQLTGAVKAPNTVIVSDTSAGSPDAIIDLTNKTETARAVLDTATKAEKKANEQLSEAKQEMEAAETTLKTFNDEIAAIEDKAYADQSTAEKKKIATKKEKKEGLEKTIAVKNTAKQSAKETYEAAQKTTEKRKQAFDAIDSSRVAALTGGGTAKNTAVVTTVNQAEPLSYEAVKEVSKAVVDIVEATMQLNYWTEVCTTLIGQNGNEKPQQNSALALCNLMLAARNDEQSMKAIFVKASEAYGFGGTDWGNEKQQIKPTIKQLQLKLNSMGFTDNANQRLVEDDKWGTKTEQALHKLLATCKDVFSGALPKVKENKLAELFKYAVEAEKNKCTGR